jgi:hypothetical protein
VLGYARRMHVPALLTRPAGAALAAGFVRLAARRGGEGVHTAGLPLTGTLALRPRLELPGVPLLRGPGTYAVTARSSWGIGPVRGLPDVAGLGLRLHDADGRGGVQDLLLDSSLAAPHDRVLVLRRSLAGWYGTPLRLRLGTPGGPKVNVAVRLRGGRVGLDTVAAAGIAGTLLVHTGDRLLAAGELSLRPADGPPGPRFDLRADAGGLVSAGFWTDLRVRTYAASRDGDPRPVVHSEGSSTHSTM